MTTTASVATFISQQRELLERLDQFAGTPEYRRLLGAVAPMTDGDLEPWLAQWLIRPAFGLGALPIDAVALPGGVALVEQHLLRRANDMVG